jgi:hypothetical protein
VPTPPGAQVPISALADIDFRTGPPSIRNENGQLVGFVFVDVTTTDIDGYVTAAAQRVRERVQFPPGYYIQWAGQFEYLKSAEQRLAVVIPFTLLIIFLLIFLNTKSVARTAIVLLAVPFSLVGAFWFLYLLNYNMSVAVWVGLIALAGLDAETGVVMLLYLDHAWDKFAAEGRLRTPADLRAAVIEGAVQRIRPKIMTVCAILFGLLPIMWSPVTQAGADVMKRIAAPMIGGVITSAVLELLLYPTIYILWRRRHLPEPDATDVSPLNAPGEIVTRPRRRRLPWIALVVIMGVAAGGYILWQRQRIDSSALSAGALRTPFATRTANGLTVNFYHPEGGLKLAMNEVAIEFRDAGGGLVDVGTVKFDLDMNMPGMVMHSGSTITPEGMPGRYRAEIKPDMAGDWTAQLHYDGPRGSGQFSFTVNVASP